MLGRSSPCSHSSTFSRLTCNKRAASSGVTPAVSRAHFRMRPSTTASVLREAISGPAGAEDARTSWCPQRIVLKARVCIRGQDARVPDFHTLKLWDLLLRHSRTRFRNLFFGPERHSAFFDVRRVAVL